MSAPLWYPGCMQSCPVQAQHVAIAYILLPVTVTRAGETRPHVLFIALFELMFGAVITLSMLKHPTYAKRD